MQLVIKCFHFCPLKCTFAIPLYKHISVFSQYRSICHKYKFDHSAPFIYICFVYILPAYMRHEVSHFVIAALLTTTITSYRQQYTYAVGYHNTYDLFHCCLPQKYAQFTEIIWIYFTYTHWFCTTHLGGKEYFYLNPSAGTYALPNYTNPQRLTPQCLAIALSHSLCILTKEICLYEEKQGTFVETIRRIHIGWILGKQHQYVV